MARTKTKPADATTHLGFEALVPFRKDLAANTATRASARTEPGSHLAGLLRSERHLLANPPFNDSDWSRKDYEMRWQFGIKLLWNPKTGVIFQPSCHAHLS